MFERENMNSIYSIMRVCKDIADDVIDKALTKHRKNTEIKKFKDQRRVAITQTTKLSDKEKKQIDDYFKMNYGAKIPYTWHRHYTAFTGEFDVKYFPELLYIPEFEHYMNQWKSYCITFADKNVLPLIAKEIGIKTPSVLFTSTKELLKDASGNIVSKDFMLQELKNAGTLFVKTTVDSNSGSGCALVSFENGIDRESGRSMESIINRLGGDFAVQKQIICHKTVSDLHPQSVNTFRVMSYRWKDEIIVAPATMRIGTGGSNLDNVHTGGLCIAIDDDGTLHKCAYTEFNEKFVRHPDSKILFEGYKIESFNKVLHAAKILHENIPQVGLVHWDFTIDNIGEPVVIEANTLGTSIQLIQRPLGKGAFGERTEEILQWMSFMRKLNVNQRKKYAFGKMPVEENKKTRSKR